MNDMNPVGGRQVMLQMSDFLEKTSLQVPSLWQTEGNLDGLYWIMSRIMCLCKIMDRLRWQRTVNVTQSFQPVPIGSMYGSFTYIYHKIQPFM